MSTDSSRAAMARTAASRLDFLADYTEQLTADEITTLGQLCQAVEARADGEG